MLTTDPSAQLRPGLAATITSTPAAVPSTNCLACRVDGRVIAVPAAVVERIADFEVQPLFPACPAWIAGLACDAAAGTVLVVRPRGAWRAGPGRAVLVRKDGRVRWALAIDAVEAMSPRTDSGVPADGWDLPAGWLRATTGGEALLDPGLVQAHLDAVGAQRSGDG
jgi:hypothetical protein